MKHHLLFASLCLLAAAALQAQTFQSSDGNITFKVTSTSPAQVQVSAINTNATTLVIPSKVTHSGVNYTVTAVAEEAAAFGQLTSVEFGDSITSIGDYAFCFNESLTSVRLPRKLKTLGDYAFSTCPQLATADIPGQVESIGKYAFVSCSLTQATLPATLSYLGPGAFACNGGDGIKAFNLDAANPVFTAVDGVIYSKDMGTLVVYPCGKTDASYTVPTTVHEIGEAAFYWNKKLQQLSLPESVQKLNYLSFGGMSSLQSLAVPSKVTEIPRYCFHKCTKLTTVLLPQGVDSIGESAFSYCSSLSDLTLPPGIRTIGNNCLYGTALRTIVVPGKVTSLGKLALASCSQLESVELPASLGSIAFQAFASCRSLTSITAQGTEPATADASAFSTSTFSKATLHVPAAAVEAYKAAAVWKRFTLIAGDASGITDVMAPATMVAHDAYYNLQGQRVMHPTRGIYIHQGKKVIIK